ncbi:ATP-binding protein [Streptodolium elevatio]|uniref:ATP-binding protein n=1 Tax=Streptodolium elevatio TaxID=3157996 RepID=A0ABV3DBN3_9ACTN
MSETAPEAPPDGTHVVTVICAAVPELAKPVRDFVAAVLGLHGDSEVTETGRLVCSELFGNSVRHVPGSRTEVTVHHDKERPAVVIAVADEHPKVPAPRALPPLAEDGRGLGIVAAVSQACGTHAFPDGKRVWSRLGLTV